MTAPIEVRLATESDLPRILELSNWAAENTVANFATEPELLADWLSNWKKTSAWHPWLVALENGAVIGFAKSSPHKERGAYAWSAYVAVYIDPAHHKKGVGTKLYAALIPLMLDLGYVTLLAGIVGGHEPSERLHKNFGFAKCGSFRRVGWKLGAWRDVGYWELHLQGPDYVPMPVRAVDEIWKS